MYISYWENNDFFDRVAFKRDHYLSISHLLVSFANIINLVSVVTSLINGTVEATGNDLQKDRNSLLRPPTDYNLNLFLWQRLFLSENLAFFLIPTPCRAWPYLSPFHPYAAFPRRAEKSLFAPTLCCGTSRVPPNRLPPTKFAGCCSFHSRSLRRVS